MQRIEKGQFVEVSQTVLDYAALLGLEDGEVERIVHGKQQAESEPAAADASRLPLPPAVEYELRSSETLEAGVVPLGPDEADGHIIVILQGRKGATPEELQRIAARYRKPRRMLQGLAGESDEVAES